MPARADTLREHQFQVVQQTFALACGTGGRYSNAKMTSGVEVTYRFWWLSHTDFLTNALPPLTPTKYCSTSLGS